MPFALLIIGVFLLIAGVRNTQDTLFTLVRGDFTGNNNFVFWIVSILIIGAVGYIPKLKPISTGFLVLVIMVLFLKRGNPQGIGGGIFAQFTTALNSTKTATPPATGVTADQQHATTQDLLQRLAPYLQPQF
jgi:hypothetical protein